MEISPFSFDDLSQFYPTPYPEITTNTPIDSSLPLKRRRTTTTTTTTEGESDNHESVDFFLNNTDTGSIKDILASVLMFGDEEDQNQSHPGMGTAPSFGGNYNFTLTNNNNNNYPILNQNQILSAEATAAAGVVSPTAASSQPKRGRNAGQSAAPTLGKPVVNRRMWVKDRSKDWWDKCSHPDYPDEEFKKSFRMSKATFNMLCDELEPLINKKDTMLRAAIPVRHRVAVCIWRLATGEPLREVSKRFGLGISTCHKLVLEVCTAIKTSLMGRFLQWPDNVKLENIKEEFKSMTGIPNVGGAIYTTHIPVIAPKQNVGVYFNKRHTERNQKTSYTVTLQGMVDPSGVFTDVCIGWPGSFPDEKVLEESALFKRASGGLMKDMWMVGNSSYPLMDWVLVPYSHTNLTWAQHAFNEKVGEIQKVAKDSFYRLKKRWGCLQKRTEVKLQELPIVLGACCVLHNICEMRKDEIVHDPENSFELFDDEVLPENVVRSSTAVQARDQIAHHLLHHGLGGNTFL